MGVLLEEKKWRFFELFGRPKPKTWTYNGVDYFISLELREWSGLGKGKIYNKNVPRIPFTQIMREQRLMNEKM